MYWPWVAAVGLVTARDLGFTSIAGINFANKNLVRHQIGPFPAPSDYLATFIVMGPLAALSSGKFGTAAKLAGWGYVLSIFFNIVDPVDPLNSVNQPQTAAQSTAQYQASTAGTGSPAATAS